MKAIPRRKTFLVRNDALFFTMPSLEVSKGKVSFKSDAKVSPGSKVKLSKIDDSLLGNVEKSYTSAFVKVMLYFYRVFGISFGGMSISTKTNTSQINKLWKIFGFANNVLLLILIGAMIYYLSLDHSKTFKYDKNISFWLLLFNGFSYFAIVAINSLYLQFYGSAIHKLLLKYPINQKMFFWFITILSFHILIPLITLTIDMVLMPKFEIMAFLTNFMNRFYFEIFSWTPSIITWFISIAVYEHLNCLRTTLMQGHFRNANTISTTRKKFVQTRDQICDIDSSISFVHLANVGFAIYGFLVQIFISLDYNIQIFKLYSIIFITVFENLIKVIISCIIHGLLHDRSDKVMSALHNIELQTAHEDVYKEALYFSSIKQNIPFGFTIAGLLPFRKTSLLPVSVSIKLFK
jgi:hypothetical protein